MRPARAVIVFAKRPQLGRVKQRLARGIGQLAALRFYRDTVVRLLGSVAADGRWQVLLALTPDSGPRIPGAPAQLRCIGQGRGDLGRRMHRAMQLAGSGPVVLIGGDIPHVTPAHLARAFGLLGRADIVFGPAEDGGFWLVGLAHPQRVGEFYRNIRWSSEHALADCIARLPVHRRWLLADRLADVDTADDLRHLAGKGAKPE